MCFTYLGIVKGLPFTIVLRVRTSEKDCQKSCAGLSAHSGCLYHQSVEGELRYKFQLSVLFCLHFLWPYWLWDSPESLLTFATALMKLPPLTSDEVQDCMPLALSSSAILWVLKNVSRMNILKVSHSLNSESSVHRQSALSSKGQ